MATTSSQQDLLPPPATIDNIHKVYSIAIACAVLGIFASLVVLLRLGLRIRARAFGLDDWAVIPALLLYIGWTAMATYVNLHAGVGKPLWEITVGEYSIWFKGILGSAWLYPSMTGAIRISILFFYYRIFVTPQARLKVVLQALLALQVVYLVVYSILPAFVCRPLYKAWHPLERELYCNDWYYYYSQVALYSNSMAFDIILLVLPLYPVWKLHMPVKRRLSVGFVFMLGAAAGICAAYKLAIFVVQMARFTQINPRWLQYQMSMLIPPQFDTYGRTFWIPSQVEPTVALIGTSLPAIRQPLISITSKVWSQISFSSATHRTKPGSKAQGVPVRSTSQRPRSFIVSGPKPSATSGDSETALYRGYTELSDWDNSTK